VGPTRAGPISGTPPLLTSLADFVGIYGSIDALQFDDAGQTINYLGQSVREFFDNGGNLLYVSRIFNTPLSAVNAAPHPPTLAIFGNAPVPYGYAWVQQAGSSLPPSQTVTWTGRYPGTGGNVTLVITLSISPNVLTQNVSNGALVNTLRATSAYDVVWISPVASLPTPGVGGAFYWAENYLDKATGLASWRFHSAAGGVTDISQLAQATEVRVLKANLQITYPGSVPRVDVYSGLTFDPRSPQSFAQQFGPKLANDAQALRMPVVFSFSDDTPVAGIEIAEIMLAQTGVSIPGLIGGSPATLTEALEWGSDGFRPSAAEYQGIENPADPQSKTGLIALEDIADVSIVAAPGSSFGAGSDPNSIAYLNALQTSFNLIAHCEKMAYRIAVLDAPDNYSVSQISAWRGQIESSYAALYFPWVKILDPTATSASTTPPEITLPPSGFIAGIYARSDNNFGPHKAPANEVVTDALRFELMLNTGQQDVLNPLAVNCFRYFPGRGYLLWGARTATSDTSLMYVNLRRYLNYLKRSIDIGTQYIVFENNGPDTWASTQQIVSDFLYSEFINGRLFGTTRAQAFFVRCDQTTMTANDITNGRLVCLIGVALLRPAEFVIFRIGQLTANAGS
jgi:hypothetical protein